MSYKFPIIPDIGLKVHKTFPIKLTYFDTTFRFNVRSQSEANIARSCLLYYAPMWKGDFIPTPIGEHDTVIDIGAHVGFFSIPISTRVKRVIAFEPSPANYAILERNIRTNSRLNIVTWDYAVGDQKGKTPLYLGVQGTTGHSITSHKRGGVQTEVSCTTLSFIQETYHPTVLKLDCEGAEWGILSQPADLEGIRIIVAELHKVNPIKLGGLKQTLSKAGFKYQIKSNSWFSKLIAFKETK